MVKLVALFRRPEDPAAFDREYAGHLELARRQPHVQKMEVARVTGAPRGESPYYVLTELYFDSMADLQASVASDEAKAAGRNLMSFAKDLVTFMIAEVEADG